MYATKQAPARELIASTWIMDSLSAVRDALLSEGRTDLARPLSECLGGLAVVEATEPTRPAIRPLVPLLAERGLLDDGPDFEDSAAWTPDDVLARDFELPALSGGAPEPFFPTDQDWQDMHDATDDRDWYREIDARAAGLPI